MQSPNVLLIFMDDFTHWALSDPRCRTPRLDALRARGTTFTHAFNQGSRMGAVCLPAREMLLSGQYLHHIAERLPQAPRLPETFRDAGYRTYFTGKWHNEEAVLHSDYDRLGPWGPGMLHSSGTAEEGTDPYHRPDPANHWNPADPAFGGHWLTTPDGRVEHSSQRWTDAAIDFLKDEREDQPFFLHVAYHAPHDPRQAPQEFLDLYPLDSIDLPPNVCPRHPFDNGDLDVRDELLAPFPRTPDAIRLHRAEYQAIVSHVDHEIGRLLDQLESQALSDSTIVVFSGDHGLALGEHGLLGKQNCYDHSIRVPLVVAGPGVPAGEARDDLVYSGSIFPTLCSLTDVTPPDEVEFESLTPILNADRDGASAGLGELYGAYRHDQRWLRTTSHKLITYPGHDHTQLFDLSVDPWEMNDLARDPDHRAVVDDLCLRLEGAMHRYGDPLVTRTTDGTPTSR